MSNANAPAIAGLDDPGRNGLYPVTDADIAVLATAAGNNGLLPVCVDLAGCQDKPTALARLATAFLFPAGMGGNWDALADALDDLSWLPATGYSVLLRQAGDLQHGQQEVFVTLLEILQDVAEGWAGREVAWQVFVGLPVSDFSDAA